MDTTVDTPARAVPKVLSTGYWAVLVFSLVGAFASKVLHLEAQGVAQVSSLLVLALATLNIAWLVGRPWVCLGVMALGGAVEAIGVTTGLPFGRYLYTEAWWPTVGLPGGGHYPVGVPLAWLLVVGGLWLVVGGFTKGWQRVLAVGMAAALFDAPLEDLMTNHLGYWKWLDTGPVFGAPFLNSVGWLATASVAAIVLGDRPVATGSRQAAAVLAGYCLLMGEIALLAFRPSWPVWLVITAAFSALGWGGKARR